MSGPKLPKGNIHPNLDAVSTCPTARANSEPGQVFGLGSHQERVSSCVPLRRVCACPVLPRLPRVAHVPARSRTKLQAGLRRGTDPLVGAVRMPQWTGSDQGASWRTYVCFNARSDHPTFPEPSSQSRQRCKLGQRKKKLNKSFVNRAPVLLPNRAMYFGPEHVSTNGHTHAPSDKPELQRRSIQELL